MDGGRRRGAVEVAALDRARRLYDAEYARRYRSHDRSLGTDENVVRIGRTLRDASRRFLDGGLVALDLGCGTGRYLPWLENVELVVGVDAAPAMLDEARRALIERPFAGKVEWIEADIFAVGFADASFHLVYAIGVLAEHAPLTATLVERIQRWLKPGGFLIFTTVDALSPSVVGGPSRRLARRLLSWTRGGLRRWIGRRLCSGGLYADEALVRDLLGRAGLRVEAITRFTLDERWQCLCVARKPGGHA